MGWSTLSWVVVYLSGLSAVLGGLRPPVGPYDIKVSKFEDCEDEGTGQVFITSRISSAGHGKYIYDSPLNLGVPIDDKFRTEVEVQQWGNGGYRPRTFTYSANNCADLWKNVKDFLISFMKSTGNTLESCPVPARNYTPNWEIALKVDGFPTMPYNKYKMIVQFLYENKKVGCEIVYAETVPKSSKG